MDTDHGSEFYDEIARKSTDSLSSSSQWGQVLAEYLVDTAHFLRQDLYAHFLSFTQRLHFYLNQASPTAPTFTQTVPVSAVSETLKRFLEKGRREGCGRGDSEIAVHMQRWMYANGYIDLPLEVIEDRRDK